MKRRDILKSSLFLPIFSEAFSLFDNGIVFGDKDKVATKNVKKHIVFSKNSKKISRITTPIINKTKSSWVNAFRLMYNKAKSSYEKNGIYGIGAVVGGDISFINAYSINKLFRAGFRTNQLYSPDFALSYNQYLSSNLMFGSYGNYATIDKKSDFVFWDNDIDFSIENKIVVNVSSEQKKIIIKYLMNEILKHKTKQELLKYFIFARYDSDSDNNKQWFISYETFKKELSKYSFEYANSHIKNSVLLYRLKSVFVSNKNIISLYSDKTNKELELLLLINSLHLLSDKHSKKGCGAISLSKINFQTINGVGLYPFSLPGNMSLEYKNFYDKIHAIWNLPEQTLNPFIENIDTVLDNIQKNNVKFLWIFDSKIDYKLAYIIKEAKKNGLFVVSSQSYKTDLDDLFDMILPTTTKNEEWYFEENSLRETRVIPQKTIPPFQAMSILWQIIEFGKLIKLEDVWKISKIDSKKILKDITDSGLKFGYYKNDSLSNILFLNKNCKAFKKSHMLNSEANGKSSVYDSLNLPFLGYDVFVQKYLFEEFRSILFGSGLDLDSFDSYLKKTKRWPVVLGKETLYRFNTDYDFYAKKANKKGKYVFYGKRYKKSLPFGDIKEVIDNTKRSFKYKAKVFYV